MADSTTTVAELREKMADFVAEREWDQFHSPKNLSMSLSVEAAELMEHFLWMTNDESLDLVKDAKKLAEVADELADVAMHLLALSNVLGLDMSDAIAAKMVKTAHKYPAELSRGRYQRPEIENNES